MQFITEKTAIEKHLEQEFMEEALKVAKQVHSQQHKKDEAFDVKISEAESPIEEKAEKKHSGIHGTVECSCGWKKPLKEVLEEAQKSTYAIKSQNEPKHQHGYSAVESSMGYAANKKMYKRE